MRFTETKLKGAYIIDLEPFNDERGFFARSFCKKEFEKYNLNPEIVQCNVSYNKKAGTLRGMHFQKEHPQGKLVRIPRGAVYNAVVDLRKNSATYGKWFGVELSDENKKMLYIPPGFAQGFLIMADVTDYMYKCTDFYYPEDEGGFMWDDPKVGIQWPLEKVGGKVVLSDKDRSWPPYENIGFSFDL